MIPKKSFENGFVCYKRVCRDRKFAVPTDVVRIINLIFEPRKNG